MKLIDLFESPVVDTILDDNGNPDIQLTIYTTDNRSEHPPAHVHAQTYDGSDVPIDIKTGNVINSKISYGTLTRGNRLIKIRRWIKINYTQLLRVWALAKKVRILELDLNRGILKMNNILYPKIINANVVDNYNIYIKFDNNISGIKNCINIIELPIFHRLKNIKYFKQLSVSKWGRGDIIWPNGEDISAMEIYNEFTNSQFLE